MNGSEDLGVSVMMEQFFTIGEVAKILKVHENTVRKILRNGGIRGIKVGREWRITGSAINAFAREAEQDYREEDHSTGKYAALTRYLSENGQRTVELSFRQIEEILAFPLPLSARKHNAWWHEEKTPRAQKLAWSEAGYSVRRYSIREEKVLFQRKWTDETFLLEIQASQNQHVERNVTYFLKLAKKLDLDLSWEGNKENGRVFYGFDHSGRQQPLFCLSTNGLLEIHLESLKKVAPFNRKVAMDRLVERLHVLDVEIFREDELQYLKVDLAKERDVSVLKGLCETFEWVLDMVKGQEILMCSGSLHNRTT